ncbi:MAG: DMT family transporter [Patescibacteria group bacterium]
MLTVLFASIGYAGAVVTDKVILSKNRVPVMRFIPLLFILLAVITALLLPLFGSIDWAGFLSIKYLAFFTLMIVAAVTWNVFYYQGIQKENLTEFELIMLFSPLATVMLASIFLPAERDWSTLGAGVLASVALIGSRFRRHHWEVSRAAKRTILAMILMSFESILIKEVLAVMSPVMLYFIRTTVIAIVFLVLYRPKLSALSPTAYGLIIITAIFSTAMMVLKFYGFRDLGVVETTTVLLLGPLFVYLFCYLYFKERLYKRDLLAVAVIVLSILYVQFWQ